MRTEFSPLQVLLAGLAGWLNRHQQDVIAYLVEENRILKEQLLAAKAKRLGRRVLDRIAHCVADAGFALVRRRKPAAPNRPNSRPLKQ
jgi:hypothetical protein